ncbi:hypothetical protein MMC19_005073 [Ptychographa xylographoides]|nr:hypothetical protein [Ptychographa xylographoides]
MSLVPMPPPEYAFVNTEVSPNVQNAFHALALDEHRKPFSPTIWERPEGQELPFKLEQVWFPGVHSNIGGSYADTEIADISLAWMMSRLDQFIDFDPTYITWQRELNVKYYERQEPPRVQPWAFGELYDSLIGWAVLGGSKTRTPGQYHVTNSKTGKSESRKLHHTEEHIHPCVRARITAGCRGIQGKSLYKPRALKGFRLLAPGEAVADSNIAHNLHSADSLDRFRWVYHCHDGTTVIIPECNMGDVELQLKATLPALTGSMPMFAQKNVSTDAV